MAAFIPPPPPPEESPAPPRQPRAAIYPERPRAECLEAWALVVEDAMILVLYAQHPQDAYDELLDVYGVSPSARVAINRAPGADHCQPEGPTLEDMLDRLGLFGNCRECGCTINAERQEGARSLDPRYYKALGALFCCDEHQRQFIQRWEKSRH